MFRYKKSNPIWITFFYEIITPFGRRPLPKSLSKGEGLALSEPKNYTTCIRSYSFNQSSITNAAQ